MEKEAVLEDRRERGPLANIPGLHAELPDKMARANLLQSLRRTELFFRIIGLPLYILYLHKVARHMQESKVAAVGRDAD